MCVETNTKVTYLTDWLNIRFIYIDIDLVCMYLIWACLVIHESNIKRLWKDILCMHFHLPFYTVPLHYFPYKFKVRHHKLWCQAGLHILGLFVFWGFHFGILGPSIQHVVKKISHYWNTHIYMTALTTYLKEKPRHLDKTVFLRHTFITFSFKGIFLCCH